MFPTHRPRRLRQHPQIRRMVQENLVTTADLIYPLFAVPGEQDCPGSLFHAGGVSTLGRQNCGGSQRSIRPGHSSNYFGSVFLKIRILKPPAPGTTAHRPEGDHSGKRSRT